MRTREETRWDKETDVVIVGYGATGAAAAIEAADAGARVVIMEKMPKPGGNTLLSGGVVYGAGTSIQKAAGIEDNAEEMLKYFEAVTGGTDDLVNEAQVKIHAQMSGENIEWLIRLGVDFPAEFLHNSGYEELPQYAAITSPRRRAHVCRSRTGRGLMEPLEAAIKARGIEVMFKTPLKKLITRAGTREVLGVECENMNIRARKAVILATGGFAMNPQMVKNYLTPYRHAVPWGAKGITGDGIRAGHALGADLVNMGSIGVMVGVSGKRASQIHAPTITIQKLAPCILVRQDGKRFGNEYMHYNTLGRIISGLEGQRCFCIFDENTRRSHGPLILLPRLSDDLSKELELGIIKKGETIEELAGKLGIDSDALAETVSAFNENAARGVDPEFGRELHLTPVETAPFYGMTYRSVFLGTHGGLKTNTRGQVVDVFEDVIPRLYAGGEMVGSTIGTKYPASGCMLMHCFAAGRICGRNAAAEKLLD